MPIPITCPRCGAAYPVADDLRGRTLLCKECDQPIVVREPGPRRKRSPLRIAVGAVVIALALVPAGALGVLWWTGWLWDQVDWPTPHEAGLGANEPAVTLHLAGVEDTDDWREIYDDLGSLADGGHAHLMSGAFSGGRGTVILTPVNDPDEFARRVHFGTVYRVRGRVVTVALAHGGKADPVAKALSDLNSDNTNRWSAAARRLPHMKTDERREKVARALERRLDALDPATRARVAESLGVWGTKESVTPLLKALGDRETSGAVAEALRRLHEGGMLPDERRGEVARALEAALKDAEQEHHDPIIKALGQLKDEESAEPLAQLLENTDDLNAAAAALRALGPSAEKAVAKRLKHDNFLVRGVACAVLRDIGTPASIPALKALERDQFSSFSAREAIRGITTRHGVGQGK